MDKQDTTNTEINGEELEKKRFKKFLDRLTIFHHDSKKPVRTWLAWVGIVLFIALVIAYYAVNGG